MRPPPPTPGLSARVQIREDRGSIVIDDDKLTYVHLADDEDIHRDTTNQVSRYTDSTGLLTGAASTPGQLADVHRLQYLNVLAALDGREKLRVDLQTIRRSVALIGAAYESAQTGRPVTL